MTAQDFYAQQVHIHCRRTVHLSADKYLWPVPDTTYKPRPVSVLHSDFEFIPVFHYLLKTQ